VNCETPDVNENLLPSIIGSNEAIAFVVFPCDEFALTAHAFFSATSIAAIISQSQAKRNSVCSA
jgi:hypothetical protein